MKTMWIALKICLPITLMTFAIFTRSNMVVTTGWPQLVDTLLVIIGTCATAFAMFGRFSTQTGADLAFRLALAVIACFVLFHPNDQWALIASPLCAVATIIGILRHPHAVPPPALVSETAVKSQDLSALVAEAKREI
jgi:TRAP-type uncharacterized transport system fused permease subunit